ncbi:MAG TPA: ATP-binding protein [Chitinispirillaceae bacterium]|nr:ATP-binding protein [Chitinispirillaceae bacterium]
MIEEKESTRKNINKTIENMIKNKDPVDDAGKNENTQSNHCKYKEPEHEENGVIKESGYREIVENANSIIFRWNTDGKVTFVNDYTLSFFGYTEKEVLGKSISVFFVKRPELENQISSMISDMVQNPDKYVNMVHENVRSDGERVWVTYTNKPLKNRQGNVIEILSVGNDITRLKMAEKELLFRANLEKLTGTLSANLINVKIDNFVKVINNSLKLVTKLSNMDRGCICLFEENNEKWLKCEYEWHKKELDRNIYNPVRIHIDDFPYINHGNKHEIYYVPDVEILPDYEYKQKLKQHKIRSLIVAPLVFEGETLGYLVFESYKIKQAWSEEIVKVLRIAAMMFANAVVKKQSDTLLRENENKLKIKNRELDTANERLRELDKSKSEFVSMASHELRTPLTGIIGMTQTLLAKDIDLTEEERERFLGIIESEGKRLASLLNELLDLTKIETGSTEIRLEKENLTKLIKETMRIISVPEDKKLELLIPEKDHLMTLADHDRLKQVLMNLIDNAISYSGENGKVSISVDDKDKFLQVNVSDTGPGINSEDQGKIFEKFYRTKGAKKSRKKGSGLGLTIAKNIIEAHGGKLWVNSETGKGSTFSFTVLKADNPGNINHTK